MVDSLCASGNHNDKAGNFRSKASIYQTGLLEMHQIIDTN